MIWPRKRQQWYVYLRQSSLLVCDYYSVPSFTKCIEWCTKCTMVIKNIKQLNTYLICVIGQMRWFVIHWLEYRFAAKRAMKIVRYWYIIIIVALCHFLWCYVLCQFVDLYFFFVWFNCFAILLCGIMWKCKMVPICVTSSI